MATYANTTFATLAEIKQRISDEGLSTFLQLDTNSEKYDSTLTEAQTSSKLYLQRQIELWGKDKFPDTINAFLQKRRSKITEFFNRMENDVQISNGIVYTTNLGSLNGISELYLNAGAPVNGTTLANTAKNGSHLIDTTNWRLYINRNTLASPTWARVLGEDVKDYLLNPEVLKDAYIYGVFRDCCQKGMFRNRDGIQTSLDFMLTTESYWAQKRSDELFGEYRDKVRLSKGMLNLLKVDFSGDGDMSDSEMEVQNSGRKLFA